ncbi:hypothetical protein PSN45_000617 [Yamadazyma tenuis]|uniref:Uncharacterized protein n=1 Tax=Candida tenuis (strain ATCC 10573 / BCRC 21748 / CBS 615 / JCM 9827 / NBRC 10315 / NRRL Y-1498 / VKM Y-70) TaxID=590646 RepID=G3B9L7_CANTC|nr:uncharacterized protein CANTEDRAFT_99040 [Yamadazyma tenuis ATCC 10573]EGV61924.1 hypothetical protein CANTEDRAFT_99040 [Yamadazyma tenuis ATCC 10573]WEJ93156.1 hypothetical protein PSN45_000617 [Yamadazyma tenuis]
MEKKGLSKVLPAFRAKSATETSQLSIKDKRYYQQVEKSLLSFESLEEWADYIAFISRLQKALSLPQDQRSFHTVELIPYASEVADKLSLCLSSKLPNGVHQKALNLYESIFLSLKEDVFSNEINLWLPGLLPVLSFGSIQVKSEMVKLFKNHILSNINSKNLKVVAKPMILSLLSGLDDENSESFPDVFELMDTLKLKLESDSHYWKCLFLAIITNPEKRLGALYWCNKRLPMFTTIKTETGGFEYSYEAQACIDPSPGLLIRAFSTAINTETIFNPANDIIIIRGFFDLMLTHLPLNSSVFARSPKDKDLLVKSCIQILLKKDMSLNRRLWNWLLGPDSDQLVDSTKVRAKYFEDFGLEPLSRVLLDLVHDEKDTNKQIDSIKMALSLIIDKWEISHMVIPKILRPILSETYNKSKSSTTRFSEVLSSSQDFFNGIESSYIWNLFIDLIKSSNLDLLEFILSNFDINEEEMKVTHAPLALMTLLINFQEEKNWFNSVSIVIELISPKGLEPVDKSLTSKVDKEDVSKKISNFYGELTLDEEASTPAFTKSETSFYLYFLFKAIIIENFTSINSCRLCELFEKLVYTIPISDSFKARDEDILSLMLKQTNISHSPTTETQNMNTIVAFSISKLFHLLSSELSTLEKTRIIKVITTNLWPSLVSSDPTQPQVESVKCLFDLIINSSRYYVEPAISSLILQSSHNDRVKAMTCLWSHSNSNETDSVLEIPLKLVLDDLFDESSINKLQVNEFIRTIIKSGHSNRLLKMITNPLMDFELMATHKSEIEVDDQLAEFAYHLGTILHVINSNPKNLKEAFNNEFAVMDNSTKLEISKSNEWDISTYKSLIFFVIEKFLSLRLSEDVLNEGGCILKDYYNCVDYCLELLTTLISGNEPDFTMKFHSLIDNCFYYISLPTVPYQIELAECQYLKCIFHLLKLSEDSKINLNLLHIDDQEKEPFLVRFIIKGISKSQISVLLQQYMILLTRSLYLFNESVFSVLSLLNSAIIEKINDYFNKIVKEETIGILVDFEASINELISGLEDLLSISHSYLLTSKFRNKSDSKAANGQQDSSFLGNVIQGVFSIESPAVRTSEQNKLYSILLAFQDTIEMIFKIWKWADSKSKLYEYKTEDSPIGSHRSIIHLGNKLKFRSKKLFESLMDLERQEVIENLIAADPGYKSSIKLLNLLDGGRSQITLPNIFNSIMTRCYPSLLDESKKSHLNVSITEKELSRFLIFYFESIDTDTITDIWSFSTQFFKDVLAHHHHFKQLIPNLLRVISKLSLKLSNSKFGSDKKHKRELRDIFSKLLGVSVSGKRILFSSSEEPANGTINNEENNSEDDEDESTTPQGVQDELTDALSELMENFEEVIQDSEKLSSCINVIILNFVSPQIKNKKINEIPLRTLTLVKNIGQYAPNRTWKSLIYDLFMDSNFFKLPANRLEIWKSIISSWMSVETEKFNELISKVSATGSGSAGTLFMFNEKAELENKILTIKRLSFIMLTQPKDFFLSSLDDLFDQIEISLMNNVPLSFKTHISILFRVITIQFNELYLLPRWIVMCQQVISIFENILNKSMKELSFLSEEELQSILYGCKLLDQLLLLNNDEFNMQDWLFVHTAFDVNSDIEDAMVSIVDKISQEYDLTILKESPVKIDPLSPDNKKIPLLKGVTSIKSIANLKSFFESLSYLNFERVYGLYDTDFEACEADIMEDLFA